MIIGVLSMENKDSRQVALSDFDSFLFHEGTNYGIYRKLGAHPETENGIDGTKFMVWAPNAQAVALICARTGWENEQWMHRCEFDGGIWELFLPGVGDGDAYRYIVTGADGVRRWKADPMAFRAELRPANASIVCPLDTYTWHDEAYQAQRDNTKVNDRPMAIYEVHLGSRLVITILVFSVVLIIFNRVYGWEIWTVPLFAGIVPLCLFLHISGKFDTNVRTN